MSEPTKSPPAKRLCLSNEPEQLPPDVAKPHDPPWDSVGDERTLPASRPGSFDIKSLLLNFIQTDAGADDLANALKDQHIRNVLKQRGINVSAADDVGYNSLPLELRDQIREHFIADLKLDEPTCKNCPRLSAYACIDTEWRAAVEAVTFRNLCMGHTSHSCNQDLDLFKQSLVGNRPQYLECIGLPCTVSKNDREWFHNYHREAGISTNSIRRLFESMAQWQEADWPAGNIHLELMRLGFVSPHYTVYTDGVLNELEDLPSVSRVTRLSLNGEARMPCEVLLVLLLSLPRLRHLTIDHSDVNFEPLKCTEQSANHLDQAAQMHLFFANLSHATPNLKTLDVSMNRKNIENIKFPIAEYRNAVISYSQKLERLLLLKTSHAAILECLSPFRAENFDPQASPVLSWPNLTNLDIIMCHDDQDGYIGRMKQSFSLVGRAVRQMPVIQNLQMVVTFDWTTSVGQRGEDSMLFTLSVFWDDVLNGSRANLSISPDLLSCDSSFPFVVARDVASEDVKELWRESLLNGAKAVLKVHVETEDALDEDALDEDALDEDDPDDDDQDEGVLDGDNLDEGDSNEDDYT